MPIITVEVSDQVFVILEEWAERRKYPGDSLNEVMMRHFLTLAREHKKTQLINSSVAVVSETINDII